MLIISGVSRIADSIGTVLTPKEKDSHAGCPFLFSGSVRLLQAGHGGVYLMTEAGQEAATAVSRKAKKAVELAGGNVSDFGMNNAEIAQLAKQSVSKLSAEKKFFRGLYCGGTFTEEALQYFSAHNKDVTLYSNLPNRYCVKLADSEVSEGHTILDLGAEDFTAKAPHPVFDPSLRLARLRQELQDGEVGVVLLDFITGPGVAADPITAFAKECALHPEIVFISCICGSQEDPQNVAEKEKLLLDAGVIVVKSNYQSAKLASAMMNELDRR